MKQLLSKELGSEVVSIKRLNGYENVNYLVESVDSRCIFKTYQWSEEIYDLANAETNVLLHLKPSSKGQYPTPIPFQDGSYVKTINVEGSTLICRLLTFLDGEFIGTRSLTATTCRSLGTFLAQLDLNLKTCKQYTLQARKWEWDLQYLELNKQYLDDIEKPSDRSMVLYFFMQFDEIVRPLLPQLRKQIIHNDANDWNLLTNGEEISGIIDFGDLAHTPLINELAIAITYACFDKPDPLKWAGIILQAYHNITPLEEVELSILYYLVAGRLVTSVCNSAHAKKNNPDNEYASVSEESAWKLLYGWLKISPLKAENEFRLAVGLPIKPERNTTDVINKRHQFISPILSLSYNEPIHMGKAAFQYMYDTNGNTFLDAYNNIPHVGHSHPEVVAAGQRQMAKLNTNTRYLYDELAAYAEKLLEKFPPSLSNVFFVNSGSAASDLAIRMAKVHTRFERIMVVESGYHGNTQLGIDISHYKFNNPKGQGKKDYILKTDIPDTYRGKYTLKDEHPGKLYAADVIEQLKNSQVPIAAFISEPIVGCGGQVPLAAGYLQEIYPVIRQQHGVCISDEVQTGFGRMGKYFWGFEKHGVVPDMVVLGKPMGNGHPIGAVVCTKDIAESFEKGVEFFSSFGGNPVSCTIGRAVLEVIEQEQLQQNAQKVGEYYKILFRSLQRNHPCIGDVRGEGLFLGVELVNPKNNDPDTSLAQRIKNKLRHQHILISTDGPFDNVLKTKPPLCFTKTNAEIVVSTIESILQNMD